MDLKRKRSEEMEELKNKRIDRILDSALPLFAEKGIEIIAMTDIAEKSEIGVASLYRYFNTKEELSIQCAQYHWEKLSNSITMKLAESGFDNLSGYGQLELIFNLFTELFETRRDFFKFIYYFDAFVNKNQISKDRLDSYDLTIGNTKQLISGTLEKGFEDGSLDPKWKNDGTELLYYTIMHALFSMAQKLSLSENMLTTNNSINSNNQIRLLEKALLETIKAK